MCSLFFSDTIGLEPDLASEFHAHAKPGQMVFYNEAGSHHGETALCSRPAWVHCSLDSAHMHGWSFALCGDFSGKMDLQSSYTCCPLSEASKRYVAGSLQPDCNLLLYASGGPNVCLWQVEDVRGQHNVSKAVHGSARVEHSPHGSRQHPLCCCSRHILHYMVILSFNSVL